MVNGADRVVCYEPGVVKERQSDLAYDELLFQVIKSPDKFTLPGGDADEVGRRAVDLLRGEGPESCRSVEELQSIGRVFGLVLSNHVLEHVSDIDFEIGILDALAEDDAVQLHRVDFRDHRIFSQPRAGRSPVEFYRDDVLTTSNGLRACDVRQAFHKAGWTPELRAEQRMPSKDLPLSLSDRFGAYESDDLLVLTADWTFRRS
jgi:hypothetical protein